MKQAQIYLPVFLLLMATSIAACAPGGSGSNKLNCSSKGEVCITVNSVQSFSSGASVNLEISVTSQNDISDLNVAVHTNPDISIDGPKSWENYLSQSTVLQGMGMADWTFAIKPGQTLTFNRVLHFPKRDGQFAVTAFVRTPGNVLSGYDTFHVLILNDVGKVIRAKTPFPLWTPIDKSGVYGPGTPVPTECCATETPLPAPTFTLIVPTPTPPPYLAP